MKNVWLVVLSIMLAGTLALVPIGASAWASDSGGYGSDSGGYGDDSGDSGGYGDEGDSGGYGESSAVEKKAPAVVAESSSDDSGGYGGDSGGSGNEETAGYGEEEKSGAAVTVEKEEASVEAAAAPVKKVAKRRSAPAFLRPPNKLLFVLTALGIGLALGWVLQRGRFCMNSAFRDTIFIQDWTFFRSYILALMVAIVGTNALNDIGLIKVSAQPFWPFAHIIGGYVFGLGIVLAGGCGSGIWYRCGEGLLAAWVAVLGFFIGIGATMSGLLKPLYIKMRSVMLLGKKPTLYALVGGDTNIAIKWIVIAALCAVGFYFVNKSQPFKLGKQKGYYWSVTGLLIGIIAVLAFWAAYYFGGGFARGLSFTTPTIELFNTVTRHNAQPTIFPMVDFFGYIKTTWGVLFIIGVPLGAYLSARGLKEFSWKVPPAKELLTVFGGSLMMGFGATAALGCNMGQGITGAATLSVGSIVATIAIILGNWTMVYFKFIKPMQDMDLD